MMIFKTYCFFTVQQSHGFAADLSMSFALSILLDLIIHISLRTWSLHEGPSSRHVLGSDPRFHCRSPLATRRPSMADFKHTRLVFPRPTGSLYLPWHDIVLHCIAALGCHRAKEAFLPRSDLRQS